MKHPDRSRGQGLVELALVFPLLVLLLAGIVDVGRGLHDYVVVANAAREGARYGAVNPNDSAGIDTRVRNALSGTTVTAPQIVVTYPLGNSSGAPIRVEVRHNVTTFFGNILGFQSIPVKGVVEMIII